MSKKASFCVNFRDIMTILDFSKHIEAISVCVIGFVSIVGALIPSWRKGLFSFIAKKHAAYRIWRNKEIYETQKEILAIVKNGAPKWDDSAEQAKKNHEEMVALKKIVTNGLSHSVAKLMVRMDQDFAFDTDPKFLCDENGNNWGVSVGYKRLVGVSQDFLSGTQWQNTIYGDLKSSYLRSFERATSKKEDFIGVIDIQNPITGEHRGRWRVLATCKSVGESLIYSGRFIKAEDEKALDIASQHNWDCILTENDHDPI